MPRLSLAVLVLSVLSAPGLLPHNTARADVVVSQPRIRMVRVRLSALSLDHTDAPPADASSVRREARRDLAARRVRIERCLASVDLRRDPLRAGARFLQGRLTFDRSRRPTLEITHTGGLPRAARGCLQEALRSISVRTRPRGQVVLRFRYTLS